MTRLSWLVLVLALVAASPAAATPGDVETTIPIVAPVDPDWPTAAARVLGAAGGSVAVAGEYDDTNYLQTYVALFDSSGAVATFGAGGVARVRDSGFRHIWRPVDVEPVAGGKVLLLLSLQDGADPVAKGVRLRRLNPDGSPDEAFGIGGVRDIQHIRPTSLAVAPDGSIAVGGTAGGATTQSAVVRRLDAAGTPGQEFTTDIDGVQTLADVGFDGSGRLYAAGHDYVTATSWVRRFAAGGLTTDTGYDQDGVVVLPVGPDATGSMRVNSDGTALVSQGAQLRRLTAAGALDSGFGQSGLSPAADFRGWLPAAAGPEAIAVQPDGKILAAGGGGVARWTADGQLDRTYGDGGKVAFPEASFADGIAVDAAGRAVIAMNADQGTVLARLAAGDAPLGSLDTTAPTVQITGEPPATVITPAQVTFGYTSEPRAAIECAVNGGAFGPCGDNFDYAPGTIRAGGSNGTYTWAFRATDQSGNVGPVRQVQFTVAIPAPTFLSGPTGRTRDFRPLFTFTRPYPGATLLCKIDSGTESECTDGVRYVLGEGAHTVSVRSTAGAAAERSFTVDTIAPVTSITSQPAAGDRTPQLGFTATDDDSAIAFECRVLGAGNAFTACASPWTAPSLPDGRSYVQVRAKDSAGNLEGRGQILEITLNPDNTGTVDPTDPEDPVDPVDPGDGGGGEGPTVPRMPVTVPVLAGGIDDCVDDGTVPTKLGRLTLRPDGGLTADSNARTPGSLSILVSTPAPRRARTASAAAFKRKTIVYAKGRKTTDPSGEARLQLKPTAKGKKAARRGKGRKRTLHLTVKGQFKPKSKGAKTIKMTKRLRILISPVKKGTAVAARVDEGCDEPHPPFAAVYLPPTPENVATLPPAMAAQLEDLRSRQPGQPGAAPGATFRGQMQSQSFCAVRPKRCVSQERFCATNPHICREEPNVCFTDSTICAISNHNFCSRNATRCDGNGVGRLVIWEFNYCDLSDGRDCEAPEACEVNWNQTKDQTRYAYDCKIQTATRWPPGIPVDGTPYDRAHREAWKKGEYPWPPIDTRTRPRDDIGPRPEGGQPERRAGTPPPPRPPLSIPPKKIPGEPPAIGPGGPAGSPPGGCREGMFFFVDGCAIAL